MIFSRKYNFSKKYVKKELALDKKIYYDYITGYNPIQIALNSKKRDFYKIYLKEDYDLSTNQKLSNILNKVQSLNIPINYLNNETMTKFANIEIYQNILLKCSPLNYYLLQKIEDLCLLKKSGNIIFYLNSITDPMNFGAILRNSFFFNIDFVITGIKNKPPLNGTVSKCSSGAVELMNIFCIENEVSFLKQLSTNNFKILALDNNTTEYTYKSTININDYKFNKDNNYIIIIGSEGNGINNNLKDICESSLYINNTNKAFPFSLVDSLNVGSATAILANKINHDLINK